MVKAKKASKGTFTRSKSKKGSRRGQQPRRRPRKSSDIDISQFINKAKSEPVVEEQVVDRTFDELPVHQEVLASVKKAGFTVPTPIQDQSIEIILDGNDLLGIANTGTGKTAAFLIPILDQLMKDRTKKVLIMAPTRELSVQINTEFNKLAKALKLNSVLCVGGTNMRMQFQVLRRKFNVVIGTPGRINDLIDRGKLNLSNYSIVVLDEVDRMLDMGFVNEVQGILEHTSKNRQSLFFSATLNNPVKKLIDSFSRDIKTVSVKSVETASTIEQDIVEFENIDNKLELLHDILVKDPNAKVVVFGRTKFGVQKLSDKLNKRGFETVSIHGDKSQAQRQRALKNFKKDVNVLVATDVAARGLHIDDVALVINYDIPETYDDYVHRIGRTGRAQKKGFALTFVPANSKKQEAAPKRPKKKFKKRNKPKA